MLSHFTEHFVSNKPSTIEVLREKNQHCKDFHRDMEFQRSFRATENAPRGHTWDLEYRRYPPSQFVQNSSPTQIYFTFQRWNDRGQNNLHSGFKNTALFPGNTNRSSGQNESNFNRQHTNRSARCRSNCPLNA